MGLMPEGCLKGLHCLCLLGVQLVRQEEACPEHDSLVLGQGRRELDLICDHQVALHGSQHHS